MFKDWIYKLFGIKKELDSPPWIKAKGNGKFFMDESDLRCQKYMKDLIHYWNQWGIKESKLIKIDQEYQKPNWKNYI
jgi:hypothetical protein